MPMDDTTAVSNCSEGIDVVPTETKSFILALKVGVSFTSVLSILGASLIILTYVAFRDLRTTARQLLVNLSVADWLVAATHMAGVLTNYERYVPDSCSNDTHEFSVHHGDVWCKVQGGFAMFGTISSFLWTIAVAVYLFVIIVLQRRGRKLVPAFYVLCWGIPAVLSVVFGLLKFLGFEGTGDGGWCYLKRVEFRHTNKRNFLPQIFGYDLWLYTCFIVLPILYIWIRCYVHIKMTKINGHRSISLFSRVKSPDLKLIFIPLIFLLLRIWSAIIDVPYYYMPDHNREEFRKKYVTAVLFFLGSVGSSAQGFCNAILFCVFTKLVRQKLRSLLSCQVSRWPVTLMASNTEEDTTDMDSETRSLLREDLYDRSLPQKGTATDSDSD